MSRIPPECLGSDPSDRAAIADVRFREEADKEEDEEEEKKDEGDTEAGDDDDDENSGYSV